MAGTLSPLSILLLAPYFISNHEVRFIFDILAFGNIIFALINYGNNGKISFAYKSSKNKSLFLYTYLTIRLFFIVLAVYITSFFIEVEEILLLFCILPLGFNYIEYLSECFDYKELENYAKKKLICFGLLFVVKCGLIINQHVVALVLLMNFEWLILFLLIRSKLYKVTYFYDVNPLRKWLKDSLYIYLSYFFQMFTTRYLYLDSTSNNKNSFFIIMRVIEAFNFIPNSYASKFFSHYHNSSEKILHLRKYLKSSVLISSVTSIIAAISIFVYFYMVSYKFELIMLFVFLCSYFFFKRTSLSRYIVVKNLVYTSPISYIFAFLVTLFVGNFSGNAFLIYSIYLVSAYLALPLFFHEKFDNYLKYSYASKN